MTAALDGLQSNLILTVPLAGTVVLGLLAGWLLDRREERRHTAAIEDQLRVRDQLRRALADERVGSCG